MAIDIVILRKVTLLFIAVVVQSGASAGVCAYERSNNTLNFDSCSFYKINLIRENMNWLGSSAIGPL